MSDLREYIRQNVSPLHVVMHMSKGNIRLLIDGVMHGYCAKNKQQLFDHVFREQVAEELESYRFSIAKNPEVYHSEQLERAHKDIQAGFGKRVKTLYTEKPFTDMAMERSLRKINSKVMRAITAICKELDKAVEQGNNQREGTCRSWLHEAVEYARGSIEKKVMRSLQEKKRVKNRWSDWQEERADGLRRDSHHHRRREAGNGKMHDR